MIDRNGRDYEAVHMTGKLSVHPIPVLHVLRCTQRFADMPT
ncbi:hypothetical protein [Bradyrhizobium sp. HKCCYLS20291]